MKILKKKFRKIVKEKPVLKPILKPILKRIVIKPKLGRWCNFYEGRLPYPIECQSNKSSPISYVFESGVSKLVYDRSDCVNCKRQVEFIPWKKGKWDKIKEAISEGEDLRDMNPTFKEII